MTTDSAVVTAPAAEADNSEPKEPKVVPALKRGTKATGRGLHTAGRAVIDTDLRDVGRGFKKLLSKSPVKVRIERPTSDES
jgi:hypothetical protein